MSQLETCGKILKTSVGDSLSDLAVWTVTLRYARGRCALLGRILLGGRVLLLLGGWVLLRILLSLGLLRVLPSGLGILLLRVLGLVLHLSRNSTVSIRGEEEVILDGGGPNVVSAGGTDDRGDEQENPVTQD